MTRNPLVQYSIGTTPVFNIQKCNVTIEASSYQSCKQTPKKRRCHIIDSDSE